MNTFDVYAGDVLERLKEIPDKSVNCCITSPPYYGLRDYGTGTWVGGDPNCLHKRLSKQSVLTSTGHKNPELIGNVGDSIYKSVCPLCGAVRVDKQIGLEETPDDYINKLVKVFQEVKRVLCDDGTLWVNIGDSYNGSGKGRNADGNFSSTINLPITRMATGSVTGLNTKTNVKTCKPKDLIGIPWMLAFALRSDGWYLRQDIIWEKPNPMPEMVKDRFTRNHEYVFLLSKERRYYFNHDAVQEEAISKTKSVRTDTKVDLWGTDLINDYRVYQPNGKRNKRGVWSIPVSTNKVAHFATFPIELAETCILAGCPQGGTVLDPFNGSGTSGIVAVNHGMNYIGIELKEDYIDITKQRVEQECESSIVVNVR